MLNVRRGQILNRTKPMDINSPVRSRRSESVSTVAEGSEKDVATLDEGDFLDLDTE